MYGVPADVDWSFLYSKELEQVCIGSFDVQLRFFGDVGISIYGGFDHLGPDGSPLSDRPDLPDRATTLVSLLKCRVTDARPDGGKTLALRFSNGESLRIHDDDEHYETFTVSSAGPLIVV